MNSPLPSIPFDGQIFIDASRVKWQWDAKRWLWNRIGFADAFAESDADSTGLLSPAHKILLDQLPAAGGGFGVTVAPVIPFPGFANPSGALTGSIELVSESLTIKAVDAAGRDIDYTGRVVGGDNLTAMPGIQITLSENFLDNLCIEIPTFPGIDGDKGQEGAPGLDGFNDGPSGVKGTPGTDATDFHAFTGVKIAESADLFSQAVVNVGLDQTTSTLNITKAEMQIPDDDTPADAIIALPVVRRLEYRLNRDLNCRTTLDDWVITTPADDILADSPDLYVFKLPQDVVEDQTVPLEPVRLADFVANTIDFYKNKLEEFDKAWLQEAKKKIESHDAAAKQAMASLAQQLAECEFQRPLQFALGVDAPSPQPPVIIQGGTGGGTGGYNPPFPALLRTMIIAIYDESVGYYSASRERYDADLVLYNATLNKITSQRLFQVKMCIGQQLGSIVNELALYPKDAGATLPLDTNGQPIPIFNIPPHYDQSFIRITEEDILNLFNQLNAGYGATMLVFLLDNSGSMVVDRDYGGRPVPPETDPPSLAAAKAQILANNPGLVILNDSIGDANERWLKHATDALEELIATGGLPSTP